MRGAHLDVVISERARAQADHLQLAQDEADVAVAALRQRDQRRLVHLPTRPATSSAARAKQSSDYSSVLMSTWFAASTPSHCATLVLQTNTDVSFPGGRAQALRSLLSRWTLCCPDRKGNRLSRAGKNTAPTTHHSCRPEKAQPRPGRECSP